jgi:ribosomal protein S18 acetylase RimI-like enzyme
MRVVTLSSLLNPRTGVTTPDANTLRREQPDETLVATDERGRALAVASLWVDTPKAPDGTPCAFAGHFASEDREASRALLNALAERATSAGKERLLAPINGSTWRSYRLVVESDGRVPFFLEPQTPDGLEQHFTGTGFRRGDLYASVEIDDLGAIAGAPDPYADEVARAGVTIRSLEATRFEADLPALHALSLAAFEQNPYYSPLGVEAFAEMYRPATLLMEPGIVLAAEYKGKMVGYIICYRDGAKRDCLVLKTLAVGPDARDLGLASHMTRLALKNGAGLGCRSAIFALMHEENKSYRWAAARGRVFRKYALMVRDL